MEHDRFFTRLLIDAAAWCLLYGVYRSEALNSSYLPLHEYYTYWYTVIKTKLWHIPHNRKPLFKYLLFDITRRICVLIYEIDDCGDKQLLITSSVPKHQAMKTYRCHGGKAKRIQVQN
jgi:hypothetical protein